MKKWMILSVLFVLGASALSAGVLTNTNQSAAYIRLLSRNPVMDIDGVYFNPAGLVKLSDGFHLAVHNQTIFQEKKIFNAYPLLNDPTYLGETKVPVFPNVYAVYKKGRLAFSFGFGPNAGGGTADYPRGLPSFETPISQLPALVSMFGIVTTAYDADIAFEGSSIFLGFQGNVSYALSDAVAVAAGVRYIQATNTYSGYIENIRINPVYAGNPGGAMISAPAFFTAIKQPEYAAQTSDKAVDAKQTGSGFTPILSLNLTPSERFNFSIKYEFNTSLELLNDTTQDDTGLFPDGARFRNDIPAILGLGAQYAFTPKWRAMASFNYFFDKSANWEGDEELVDKNTYELSLGMEYDLSGAFTLSVGYLRTQFGLSEAYQTDFSHELSADTVGFGARIRATERLSFDLGALLNSYKDFTKPLTTMGVEYDETYSKTTTAFAIGLNYRF